MKAKMMTVILVVGTLVGAQAQKNSLLVYGNAGYTSTNAENYASAYSFRPGIGYQFADHLTAGVNVGAWGSKTEEGTTGLGLYSRTHNFEVGPFFRYTQPLGSIFAVYGQCDVNYQHATTKNDVTQMTTTQNGFISRVWPAVGVNLKNGFALNFKFGEISYAYGKTKGGGSSNVFLADFNWTTGFQFGISKNFSFQRKS